MKVLLIAMACLLAMSMHDTGTSEEDSIGDHVTVPTNPSAGSTVFDVGSILNGNVKHDDLSPQDVFNYLKNHVIPKKNEVISQEVVKGAEKRKKTLIFQLSWLDTYKWLAYSPSAEGGLCKFCILFPPTTGQVMNSSTFVTVPFTNLRKAGGVKGKLKTHETLKYHRDSAARVQAFISTFQNPERNIQHYVSEMSRTQYELNVKILSSVVRAITFCGRRNIALLGHRDKLHVLENCGNFLALLQLFAEYDADLKNHLEHGKNALYISNTIQAQIIKIIGDIIREKVSSDIIKDGAFFSIIGDEVTETHSNREILSLCLRFVSWAHDQIPSKPSIKEVFFDFTYFTRTTGLAIATAIKDSLGANNIDISKARGQAYDGASAMSSKTAGVQARIRESAPLALYTHCRSHVLNLSIAATCQVPEVRNMVDAINSCFLFFDNSPKRQKIFELVLETKGAPTKKKHLTGLCKTRWVERHTCFETFLELYKFLSICVKAISLPHLYPEFEPNDPDSEKWNWDKDTKVTATGLHAMIRRPEFIMAFVEVKNCLHLLKGMTVKLQKRDNDILVAYNMIEETRKKIESLRTNIEREHKEWFEEAQLIAEMLDTEMTTPRIVGRQVHRANNAAATALEYYRSNYTVQFVDHLMSEFNARFSNENQVGIKLFKILPAHFHQGDHQDVVNFDEIVSELLFWENDLPHPASLKNEMKDWYQRWRSVPVGNIPTSMLDTLRQCDPDVYPCINKLLIINNESFTFVHGRREACCTYFDELAQKY